MKNEAQGKEAGREDQRQKLKARYEQIIKEREAAFASFDIRKITMASARIYTVYDSSIGEFKAGVLNYEDLCEIADRRKNYPETEQALRMIYAVLKKAYPELTLDEMRKWDSVYISKLTFALQRAGFFPQAESSTSATGSSPTPPHS
jgi:hypothetical protein